MTVVSFSSPASFVVVCTSGIVKKEKVLWAECTFGVVAVGWSALSFTVVSIREWEHRWLSWGLYFLAQGLVGSPAPALVTLIWLLCSQRRTGQAVACLSQFFFFAPLSPLPSPRSSFYASKMAHQSQGSRPFRFLWTFCTADNTSSSTGLEFGLWTQGTWTRLGLKYEWAWVEQTSLAPVGCPLGALNERAILSPFLLDAPKQNNKLYASCDWKPSFHVVYWL